MTAKNRLSVKRIKDFVHRLVGRSGCLGSICGLVLIASACATPIGVHYVDRSVAYHSLTGNVLSTERPSSFSARELVNLNLYQRFGADPVGALAEMHAGLAPTGDEDRIFALSELSFFHANNSGDRSYYLAAAVYAYAFLMPGQHGTTARGDRPTIEVGSGYLQSGAHPGRKVAGWRLRHTHGRHI